MKKIVAFFKALWIKYFIKNKLQTTPKGEAFIKYIIDMYVNFTTDEPIERYEEVINILSKEYARTILKDNLPYSTEDENQKFLHFSAAMNCLYIFLNTTKNKENWYEYIEDEEKRGIIKKAVKAYL